MTYQFIAQHRQEYAMTTLCRVLEVSVSGYYAWCKREPSQHARSDAQLAAQVKTAFQANRCVYGSPRVHAELHATSAFIAHASGWLVSCSELAALRTTSTSSHRDHAK